ncbi:DUF1284 domain-containing protein [Sulfobacillus sp. hq2]|nr:DUF1284 domain-containing protein [Sulfobacillus sp. hq2]
MKTIRLRGHHILCLLGYRGMGYSEEYIVNMTAIHQTLRNEPQTRIILITGPDDLCDKFPTTQPYHCEDAEIFWRDQRVLDQLSLSLTKETTWDAIVDRIRQHMVSGDIDTLCATCSWRPYGVCAQGLDDIKQGKGLFPIP